MFGFGKKKSREGEAPQKAGEAPAVPGVQIPDDKFTVMPREYLPEGKVSAPGRTIPKKALVLGGGAFVALAGLFAALYAVFLSPAPAPEDAPTVRPNVSQSAPEEPLSETDRVP